MEEKHIEKASNNRRSNSVDGGWGWVVLAAAFFLNFLNGGIFSIHGMLYEAFLQSFPDLNPTSTAWIIALQSGFCYVAGFSVGPGLALTTCRRITMLGGIMVAGGLLAISFVEESSMIYLFSIIAGFGMGFQCLPSSILVQNYFERYRALAGAIAVSGSSAGVFIHPPMFRLLMDTYSWRGALLVLSALFLNSIPLALLLRPLPKLPIPSLPKPTGEHVDKLLVHDDVNQPATVELSNANTQASCCNQEFVSSLKNALDFSVMKTLAPWATCTFWFLVFMGSSAFYTFITVKCANLEFPKVHAPMIISMYGIFEAIGRLGSGIVGNLRCVNRIYLLCATTCICGSSSVISGFVSIFPLLLTYAAVYGLFIGACVGLGCTVTMDIMGKALLPKVQGLNFLCSGIGSFISLPLLATSWQLTKDVNFPFYIAGMCQISASFLLFLYCMLFIKCKSQVCSKNVPYQTNGHIADNERTIHINGEPLQIRTLHDVLHT